MTTNDGNDGNYDKDDDNIDELPVELTGELELLDKGSAHDGGGGAGDTGLG